MILRGAALSDKRLSLEARVTESPAPAPARDSAISQAFAAASPAFVPAPPLTLETVLDWLAERDAATRTTVAQALAQDIDELREAARAKGSAAGEAEGLAAVERRTRGAVSALEKIADQAEVALEKEIEQVGEQCAAVVCAALAKIAGPLLDTRAAALGAVLEVLKRVKDHREIVVHVAAADLEILEAAETDLAAACGTRKFSLVADPAITSGGCIVETALGTLDARFDVQLRALLDALKPRSERT